MKLLWFIPGKDLIYCQMWQCQVKKNSGQIWPSLRYKHLPGEMEQVTMKSLTDPKASGISPSEKSAYSLVLLAVSFSFSSLGLDMKSMSLPASAILRMATLFQKKKLVWHILKIFRAWIYLISSRFFPKWIPSTKTVSVVLPKMSST